MAGWRILTVCSFVISCTAALMLIDQVGQSEVEVTAAPTESDPQPARLDPSIIAASAEEIESEPAPRPIPGVINRALPIDDGSAARRAIRDLFPNASDQGVEIWAEQLRGLPQDEVRFLLEQRRLSGISLPGSFAPATSSMKTSPGELGAPTPEIVPAQPRPTYGIDHHPLRALVEARDIILQNVANAETPAYRRISPVLASVPSTTNLPGLQLDGFRVSHTQGGLQPTERPLDLAIVGDGFFAVSREGSTYYTRLGAFVRESNGLGIRLGGKDVAARIGSQSASRIGGHSNRERRTRHDR